MLQPPLHHVSGLVDQTSTKDVRLKQRSFLLFRQRSLEPTMIINILDVGVKSHPRAFPWRPHPGLARELALRTPWCIDRLQSISNNPSLSQRHIASIQLASIRCLSNRSIIWYFIHGSPHKCHTNYATISISNSVSYNPLTINWFNSFVDKNKKVYIFWRPFDFMTILTHICVYRYCQMTRLHNYGHLEPRFNQPHQPWLNVPHAIHPDMNTCAAKQDELV